MNNSTVNRINLSSRSGRRLARALVRAGLAVALVASVAAAADKPAPKPVICASWEPAGGYHVCTDGKRPVLLTSAVVVSMPDKDGKPAKYLLGWR
jgi:DNA-binding transcriptional LysR family regulator